MIVQFMIARTGRVSSARIAPGSLDHPSLGRCVLGAMKRLEFPEPEGGGIVVVTYPFVLEPERPSE